MRKPFFIFCFMMLCTFTVDAQKDSAAITYDIVPLEVRAIDDSNLQKYQDDEAFDYEVTKAELTWWDNFTIWLSNIFRRIFEGIFGVEKAAGLLASFLRIVPYLLLGILIFLLIRFFLNSNARALLQAKKEQSAVGLSEEENLIKNEDLQLLVQKALADKNYLLAIRYYYLFLLKLMSGKERITWKLQRTNDDYIQKIKKTELQHPFSTITQLYDYIWYGDFPMDESKYYKTEKTFSRLQKIRNGNG